MGNIRAIPFGYKNRAYLIIAIIVFSFLSLFYFSNKYYEKNFKEYLQEIVDNRVDHAIEKFKRDYPIVPGIARNEIKSLEDGLIIKKVNLYEGEKSKISERKGYINKVFKVDGKLFTLEFESGKESLNIFRSVLWQSTLFITIISALFLFLIFAFLVNPVIRNISKLESYIREFNGIYQKSYENVDPFEYVNSIEDLTKKHLTESPGSDFEEKVFSILRLLFNQTSRFKDCIIQKETINNYVSDTAFFNEQVKDVLLRLSHDIQHPLAHLDIVLNNMLDSRKKGKSGYKDFVKAVISSLVITKTVSETASSTIFTEKNDFSDDVVSVQMGEFIKSYLKIPQLFSYARLMNDKNIIFDLSEKIDLFSVVSTSGEKVLPSALYNLVVNALVHGGGQNVKVLIDLVDDENGGCFLSIRIDGMVNKFPDRVVETLNGIDKDYLQRTELHHNNNPSTKGLGVGLVLTKKALLSKGGNLLLEKGSTWIEARFPVTVDGRENNNVKKASCVVEHDYKYISLLKLLAFAEGYELNNSDKYKQAVFVSGGVNNIDLSGYEKSYLVLDDLESICNVTDSLEKFSEAKVIDISLISDIDQIVKGYFIDSCNDVKNSQSVEEINPTFDGNYSLKVLILDDQKSLAQQFEMLIKNQVGDFVEVQLAKTIEEARKLFQKALDTPSPFDIVIIDMMLDAKDRMQGGAKALEIFKSILKEKNASKQPIFFGMSAGKEVEHTSYSWDGFFSKKRDLKNGHLAMMRHIKYIADHGVEEYKNKKELLDGIENSESEYLEGKDSSSEKCKGFRDFIKAAKKRGKEKQISYSDSIEALGEDIQKLKDELKEKNWEFVVYRLHSISGTVGGVHPQCGEVYKKLSNKISSNEPLTAEDIDVLNDLFQSWEELARFGAL